jgi:transcriptional regulator with XRE-family HTH domain
MFDGVAPLLRAWRTEVVKMTLVDVERRTNETTKRRSKSTIAAWESGRNEVDAEGLRQLDDCYEAKGALVDLARAIRTPHALPPRLEWAHNFPPADSGPRRAGGPVWVWLRPGPGSDNRVKAALWWGVLGVKLDETCGPDGLLLSCPVSTEHPAAFVRMSNAAGWVDFGRGVIPDALGLPVEPVLPKLHFFGVRQAAVSTFSDALHSILGSSRIFERLSRFAGTRSDVIGKAVAQFAAEPEAMNLTETGKWHKGLDLAVSFEAPEFRRLREARGLSQYDVALTVSALLPDSPVSDDQIRRFEQGRRVQVERLRSRLDMVLGADGRTCWEPVEPEELDDGQSRITFPEYWVGPVTLRVFKKTRFGEPVQRITIRWGPWETDVLLGSDTAMTLRRCTTEESPVHVIYPAGWGVGAGVGYDSSAFDINIGWHPTDLAARRHLFERLKPVYLRLFEKTPEEFETLELNDKLESADPRE